MAIWHSLQPKVGHQLPRKHGTAISGLQCLAIIAPNNGFTFQPAAVESQLSALSNVIAQYAPSLETGSVDPSQYIPEFLEALNENGVEDLLQEVSSQLAVFHPTP